MPPPTKGETCKSSGSDGCADGLVCSTGKCISPGSLVDGEKCSYNVDCAEGLVCDWAHSPYECAPPGLSGESCSHETDCAEELRCDGGDSLFNGTCDCKPCAAGLVCGASGCITPGTVEQGGLCAYNVDCVAPFICLWADKPYRCQPAAGLDEACGYDTDCAEGFSCSDANDVCRPVCDAQTECPEGEACSGGLFAAAGTRTCEPLVGEGGKCSMAVQCDVGLGCIDKVCATAKQVGEDCMETDECAPELWCDPSNNLCAEDGGVGDACEIPFLQSNAACQDGLHCMLPCDPNLDGLKGTCVEDLAEGAACERCADDQRPSVCQLLNVCHGGCARGLECVAGSEGSGDVCATPQPTE